MPVRAVLMIVLSTFVRKTDKTARILNKYRVTAVVNGKKSLKTAGQFRGTWQKSHSSGCISIFTW